MAEIVQNEQGGHGNLLHSLKLLRHMNPLDKAK
jgi:hypothetical protein